MKLTYTILMTFLPIFLFAQQLPYGSHFRENQFTANPAMTTAGNFMEINADYLQQWAGFNDAPRTISVTGQFPFDNMGIGGLMQYDKTGPFQASKFALTYAYKLPIGITSNDRLTFGIMGSISEYQVNQEDVVATSQTDVFLPVEASSNIVPNASFGVYYTTNGEDDFDNNSFYFGLAANQLISGDVPAFGDGVDGSLKRKIHANATAGVRIINDDLALEPSVWVNYAQDNIYNFNMALRMEKYESFNAGLIYSSNQTLGLQLGMSIKNDMLKDGVLRVGLLGHYNIGKTGGYQGLGYEFVIGYRFVN
ncbi:MAG: type IX secretion system PorP/SprF family membrane protein [Paraglaciecola sp.]|jgi:type IX secretion system PorP/SprF family membrane protein